MITLLHNHIGYGTSLYINSVHNYVRNKSGGNAIVVEYLLC